MTRAYDVEYTITLTGKLRVTTGDGIDAVHPICDAAEDDELLERAKIKSIEWGGITEVAQVEI